jgi:uncharacterized protein YbjT (DUF2867 family)
MSERVLAVTGATGFIGRNLVPVLLSKGQNIRVLVRRPDEYRVPGVEARRADLLESTTLGTALEGVHTAFYLVHSMSGKSDSSFVEKDRIAAENFLKAAETAGVQRIIYMGGLGEVGSGLSEHLRSRTEVGRILQSGSVKITILRAAIILGRDGASWEMLRQLVEKLPIMVTPKWLETRCQPIALRDVLGYLEGCMESEETVGGSFDIGGPDILTYRRMLLTVAEMMDKKRYILPIPVLSPRLSSYWVDLVTDVPAALANPLIEGLRNEVICRENRIRELVPIPLTPFREAVALALRGKV